MVPAQASFLPFVSASLAGVVGILVSGCAAVGPNHKTPQIPVPDQWNASVRDGLNSSKSEISGWWRNFNDSKLNTVIGTAKSGNRTLAVTAERIEEARALSGVARGGLRPMVGAAGSISRDRLSESVLPLPGPVPNNPFTFYSAGTAAAWELDFVGGLRRSVEAAQANMEATEEFHRDAMVIVFAESASAYVDSRTLQERIKIAHANIAIQKESLRITKTRNEIGLSPDQDVALAETNLARSEALVPVLRSLLAASQNRLAVLCGKYPGAMVSMLGTGSIPRPKKSASIGIPADLIRSRPDIRSAERLLAAQTALIGVAQAELYPKFTLSGAMTLQSSGSSNFTDSDSRAYSFGPSFR